MLGWVEHEKCFITSGPGPRKEANCFIYELCADETGVLKENTRVVFPKIFPYTLIPLTTHAIGTLRIREVTPFRMVECSKSYCKSCSFKSLQKGSWCTRSVRNRAFLLKKVSFRFSFLSYEYFDLTLFTLNCSLDWPQWFCFNWISIREATLRGIMFSPNNCRVILETKGWPSEWKESHLDLYHLNTYNHLAWKPG